MKVTGHDILNVVHANDNMPTLRKTIDRNCKDQSIATQNGIIKSNLISIFEDVSEKDMQDDAFFNGYALAETVINQALHFWLMEQYDVKMTDIDIVFNVVDNKPTLEIEIDGEDEGDGDNFPEEPLTPVDKLKEDLNL
jgi:hypothetical protein